MYVTTYIYISLYYLYKEKYMFVSKPTSIHWGEPQVSTEPSVRKAANASAAPQRMPGLVEIVSNFAGSRQLLQALYRSTLTGMIPFRCSEQIPCIT